MINWLEPIQKSGAGAAICLEKWGFPSVGGRCEVEREGPERDCANAGPSTAWGPSPQKIFEIYVCAYAFGAYFYV